MAASRWRTIRVFLDDNGVDEVDWDLDNQDSLRCTCAQFQRNVDRPGITRKCKHITFLLREAKETSDGKFRIRLDKDIPDEVAYKALREDTAAFRDLVIRHSTPVLL
jgi:predicted nucleic acid-binding Zn finger protein